MLSSKEKLAVFENVMARVGINDNTLREYNKAISGLMNYNSQMEAMPPPPMPVPDQTAQDANLAPQNTGISTTNQGMPPQATQSATQLI